MNTQTTFNTITKILDKHLSPDYERFIFGSWARNENKYYSDIDVGIYGEQPLDIQTLGMIENDFAESDIPYVVDVVDFARTSQSFKKTALQYKRTV